MKGLEDGHKDKCLGGRVMGAIKLGEALPYKEFLKKYSKKQALGAIKGMICHRIEQAVQFGGKLCFF